ncbi:response regulator transcription factor [Paenibacillus oceani]|uniref:Response regulator transcription factor n=1 Tax=Paenibacillus oceani TaxID=2772510 RepID=A0A927H2Q4_9BACL|nr:response regulator transcription factor [Paenibacillus oceani]MBD2865608.1 response regulator transcription factor [Paenibacillus oceani]
MKTILVVEDDDNIREVIVSYLASEGYRTLEAESGRLALDQIRDRHVDLVVLDLMLPDGDGEQVCETIRGRSPVPILMLTAKTSQRNRLLGLSLGADDYMTKPFDPLELIARVRAILRRTDGGDLLADRIPFRGGELLIDALQQKVVLRGETVALTPNEYRLLLVFARNPNRTFSRGDLVDKVLGFDFDGDARTIDQHIKNLRHKIEADPKNPDYIVTVYGIGYRFSGG